MNEKENEQSSGETSPFGTLELPSFQPERSSISKETPDETTEKIRPESAIFVLNMNYPEKQVKMKQSLDVGNNTDTEAYVGYNFKSRSLSGGYLEEDLSVETIDDYYGQLRAPVYTKYQNKLTVRESSARSEVAPYSNR